MPGLTTLRLPAGVDTLDEHVFGRCTGLTDLVLQEGMDSVGDWTFTGCTGLATLRLPEGLYTVGDHTFSYSTALTMLHLPAEGLHAVGDSTFMGCKALRAVRLPEGIHDIGQWKSTDTTTTTERGQCPWFRWLHRTYTPRGPVVRAARQTKSNRPRLKLGVGRGVVRCGAVRCGVARAGQACFSGCVGMTALHLPQDLRAVSDRAFVRTTSLATSN